MNHRQTFRHEYLEAPDPVMGMADGDDFPMDTAPEYTTYEYEGVIGESRGILQRIYDAVDERHKQGDGVYPRQIVLGAEDYLAADAWVRHDSEGRASLQSDLSVDIIVVPGRMIHVPKTRERALMDELKDGDSE